MTSALSPIESTVEQLYVSASVELSRQDIDVPTLSTTGALDLTSFTKLKYLYIPWAFLMGLEPAEGKELIHVLPQSLEILHLSCDLEETDSWDWDSNERMHYYEHEDNLDPTAIIAAVIDFLKHPKRPAQLKSILFTWPHSSKQITAYQKSWLDDLFATTSIKVGWPITPWRFLYRDTDRMHERSFTPILEFLDN